MSIQVTVPGFASYHTTGSGEDPRLCLEDGISSTLRYGVATKTYGGPCINCQYPIQVVLDFNSMTGDWFCRCPACNVVWHHLSTDGNLSDFKLVSIPINNGLLQTLNEGISPDGNGWY
jgi:hypothetical protein